MDQFANNSHKHNSKRHHKRHKSKGGSSDENASRNRKSKSSEYSDKGAVDESSHRKHRRSSRKSDRTKEDFELEEDQVGEKEADSRQLMRVGTSGEGYVTYKAGGNTSEDNRGYKYTETVPKDIQKASVIKDGENSRDVSVADSSIREMGSAAVGTLQSTEVYLKNKELKKYEKEKTKKKEKIRTEIEQLRQERGNMKASLQMEQLKKETDLLEKQKELNQFEEGLLSRQEQLYERESEIKDTLKQIEEAEGALERRQEIVQRKHEELTSMSLSQDIGTLHQKFDERKEHIRRQSIDGSIPTNLKANMNWDFLRGVFHDRNAMLTGALKACKAELAHTENNLVEKTKELDNSSTEITNLQGVLKSREKKIKELEQHLTLTLQELKSTNKELKQLKEPPQSPVKEKPFSKRPTRESLNGLSNHNNHEGNADKYVSQTCIVM